jgi:hypothetical protein
MANPEKIAAFNGLLMNARIKEFEPPPFEDVCVSDFDDKAPVTISDEEFNIAFIDDFDMSSLEDDDGDFEMNFDSNRI